MEATDIDSFFLPGGILDTEDGGGSLDLGLSSILGSGRRAKSGGARTSRLFAEDVLLPHALGEGFEVAVEANGSAP